MHSGAVDDAARSKLRAEMGLGNAIAHAEALSELHEGAPSRLAAATEERRRLEQQRRERQQAVVTDAEINRFHAKYAPTQRQRVRRKHVSNMFVVSEPGVAKKKSMRQPWHPRASRKKRATRTSRLASAAAGAQTASVKAKAGRSSGQSAGQLLCDTPAGRSKLVRFGPRDTVADLADKIGVKDLVIGGGVELCYWEQPLSPSATLMSYGFEENATVRLTVSMCGGATDGKQAVQRAAGFKPPAHEYLVLPEPVLPEPEEPEPVPEPEPEPVPEPEPEPEPAEEVEPEGLDAWLAQADLILQEPEPEPELGITERTGSGFCANIVVVAVLAALSLYSLYYNSSGDLSPTPRSAADWASTALHSTASPITPQQSSPTADRSECTAALPANLTTSISMSPHYLTAHASSSEADVTKCSTVLDVQVDCEVSSYIVSSFIVLIILYVWLAKVLVDWTHRLRSPYSGAVGSCTVLMGQAACAGPVVPVLAEVALASLYVDAPLPIYLMSLPELLTGGVRGGAGNDAPAGSDVPQEPTLPQPRAGSHLTADIPFVQSTVANASTPAAPTPSAIPAPPPVGSVVGPWAQDRALHGG